MDRVSEEVGDGRDDVSEGVLWEFHDEVSNLEFKVLKVDLNERVLVSESDVKVEFGLVGGSSGGEMDWNESENFTFDEESHSQAEV